MCEFFSALYTKDGRFLWHENTDSHELLIRNFKVHDTGRSQNFVRLELIPGEKIEDVKTWKFKVDQETCPAWFEEVREKAEKTMRKVASSFIHADEDIDLIIGGKHVICGKTKVHEIRGGIIPYIGGSAQVESIGGSAQVKSIGDSAQVKSIYGSAQVKYIGGSAQVEYIYGSAQVESIGGSAQVKSIGDSAQVEYIGGSAQVKSIYGSAQVKSICGSAQVKSIGDSAQVEYIGGSAKILKDEREKK